MAIISDTELRRITNQRFKQGGVILSERRKFSKYSTTTSVFLSHAHIDKDKIIQVKGILENLGVEVYVDWMDETMPEKTSGITASRIKTKIAESKKFILIATNPAISSKWCNWEVGIGDTYKSVNGDLAIFGLSDNMGHWKGNEYLQIYPSIEYEYGNKTNTRGVLISEGFYVFQPTDANGNRTYISLESWFKS